MHRVRVFLNGTASSSRARDWRTDIRRLLYRSELSFVSPTTREEFESALQQAAQEKIDCVISVGGDGTFNNLMQRLVDSDTSFLVVPAGTANDLARELGVTPKLQRAVECVRRNDVQKIDVISINGRLMATNGGIGIVSDVSDVVNDMRARVPGFKSLMSALHHHVYSMLLGVNLLTRTFRYYSVAIESDEFSGEVKTPMIFINNQPYIAGTFPIAPGTQNDDGKFNVTVFRHDRYIDLIAAVYRVHQNLPMDHDRNVISFETTRVGIHSLEPTRELVFYGDGECLARSKSIEATIRPRALTVFRPVRHSGEHPFQATSPVQRGYV